MFKDILCNELTIGEWNRNRLPNDSFSIDSAIIIKNSGKFPIIIDPQIQANRWIKETYRDQQADRKKKEARELIKILSPNTNPTLIENTLTICIEMGLPVLVENVDEDLDRTFKCVFEKNLKKSTLGWELFFLDRWLVLHPDFMLYATTKLSNPNYNPEICLISNIINFQVTQEGLEDQMLNVLVGIEDTNSEKARQNNIKQFYDIKKQQKETEDTILDLLNNQEGNILDDIKLIETLNTSKIESIESKKKLKDIELMKIKFQNT